MLQYPVLFDPSQSLLQEFLELSSLYYDISANDSWIQKKIFLIKRNNRVEFT